MATILSLRGDLIRYISEKLDAYDVLALALTSKEFYRNLYCDTKIKNKLCYPFQLKTGKTFKLTIEQCEVLSMMLRSKSRTKLCRGPSGHGKTFLMIAYAFYAHLRFEDDNSCVVFVLPPTRVGSFSEFWYDHIQYPALSNYSGSRFYQSDWRHNVDNFRVLIISEAVLLDVMQSDYLHERRHAIMFRKTDGDNDIKNVIYNGCPSNRVQCAIFIDDRIKFKIPSEEFKLANTTIEMSIPNPEYEFYDHIGVTTRAREDITNFMQFRKPLVSKDEIIRIYTMLSRHDNYELLISVKRGAAWLQSGGTFFDTDFEKQNAECLDSMKRTPKMTALVSLALRLQQKREKLVIFDCNQSYIVSLYYLLSMHGLTVFPYMTKYKPESRCKMISDFKQCSSGVLIGSIDLICSDSVSFSDVKNIAFFRYPSNYSDFEKAIARTSRPRQRHPVTVHLFFTCSLEETIFLYIAESKSSNIPMSELLCDANKLSNLIAKI